MRHFFVHEITAPYPGTCIVTGANTNLIQLGIQIPGYGDVMISQTLAGELAEFLGYAPKAPMVREVEHLREHVRELESQLKAVPNHTEELINGIRSSVANFVLAVSDSNDTPSDSPVSDVSVDVASPARSGKTANGNNKASGKSSSN